jgi:RNA polymerase sigma factor (TIGR02999 family)
MMRRIIVDHARRRKAAKRDGGEQITLEDQVGTGDAGDVDVVAIDEALDALARLNERQARVVELRFFGGLTIEETAEVLDVAEMTVKRDWLVAKAWLQRELGGEG